MLLQFVGLSLSMVLSGAQLVNDIEINSSECKELGFNTETLKCSTCDYLPKFNLDEIFTDCKRCCVEDKTTTHEKYPLAQIEICECNLLRFPQVNAFVKGDLSSQWGNKLKIKHVRGTLPTIVLKDASGQPQKSLNIEQWDTNTITQFINEWVE